MKPPQDEYADIFNESAHVIPRRDEIDDLLDGTFARRLQEEDSLQIDEPRTA
jgi:hypothetical protein